MDAIVWTLLGYFLGLLCGYLLHRGAYDELSQLLREWWGRPHPLEEENQRLRGLIEDTLAAIRRHELQQLDERPPAA